MSVDDVLMLKFIDDLEKKHFTVEVLSVSTVSKHAYIRDTSCSQYIYYLDFSNYPKTINISTLKELSGGYACIVYNKCSLDKFNWGIEGNRALMYETFGIET